MPSYTIILIFSIGCFHFVNSFFDPKKSKRHDFNEPMEVEEIRFELVPNYNYNKCALPKMNHPDRTKKRKDKFYYFKKRMTDISKDPSLPEYQFVVSSTSEFQLKPGKQNEFTNELGSIFCEMSMMTRVERIPLIAKNCGIERLLTALCLVDKDVNPDPGYDGNKNRKYNLNIERIFKGAPDTLTGVKMTCDRLVGMERIILTHVSSQSSMVTNVKPIETMKPFIKGAVRAGFQFILWNLSNGTPNGSWQFYSIPIPDTRLAIDQFNIDALNTKMVWYFCKIKENVS